MPPSKNRDPLETNVLSLIYKGALPEILRAIADQIEHGSAAAEQFSSVVSRDVFELHAKIHINKG